MLEQTLIHFATKMNRVHPNMNRGGCAVFAVHMAKRLQHIVPTRIKLFDYGVHDLDMVRANLFNPLDINEWYYHGVGFCHVVVEFDYKDHTYHYDTDGLRFAQNEWDGCTKLSHGHFTVEEMASFTSEPHSWNPAFNRRHQIPRVKRQIKNLFARQIYANQLTKYQQVKNLPVEI